ncbi:MAG: hypothetical protein JWR61_5344 [Ferruginibacter sp.]|uniref:glycosyltransferase family 4 protein n=1 Tax=Ferruginibacter sp. TaxID=1940288 RepID=UPI0026593A2B|nr:glycosyltransferase family 4 protein [Ferruginibacter sp.]MDB5280389.1 hypothetical protein [Ferruginibacter sp.]
MKVLIIIPDFPENLEDIKGGVQSALANLLKGFAGQEVDIRVITFGRHVATEHTINYSGNIEITYCPESKGLHLFNYLFRNSFIIRKHIRTFRPDLIHFAMGGICLATKVFGLYGKKQLVTIHGISFLEARLIKNLRERLAIYVNEAAEVLFTPNNIIHISNYSKNIKGKINKINYVIIPNAIKPAYFEIGLKQNSENRLVYVGAIDERKNIILVLKTMHRLILKGKIFTLDVLGDFLHDNYRTIVMTLVDQLQLTQYVRFHGWVSQLKVMEVLAVSDVLVVCSKQETLPMVILEAMAAGKVVVASAIGGIPEMIIDEEDGFLYDIEDEEKFEHILSNLHDNNELVFTISKKAKEKALSNYNCVNVAKKTISFYKSLIEQ